MGMWGWKMRISDRWERGEGKGKRGAKEGDGWIDWSSWGREWR